MPSFHNLFLLTVMLTTTIGWHGDANGQHKQTPTESARLEPLAQGGSVTIDLNLKNISLKNTLQMLCNRIGKNLLLDPEVNERLLNMVLTEITVHDAFNAILHANGLTHKQLQGNVYYVAPWRKLGKQITVRHLNCKYADAEEIAGLLATMVSTEGGAVLADKRTNTLIIKESPEIFLMMESLLQTLDKPTQQVYIQAEIMEVSSTDGNEFGIEWLWKTANYKSIDGEIGTNFGLGGTATVEAETEAEAAATAAASIPRPTGQGIGIGILNTNVQAVIHALREVNHVNLLSRPRIVTLDNQESTIEVGDQIPFKTLNEFGVTSFEFKDATVQLLVKPHIIDSEYILLDVSPKADFQNGFTPDGTPIISTRKASTNVKVKNGQTIVIGGLIRDSVIKSESKIPVLGSIPILGHLFKSTISTKTKTELIVFITPVILGEDTENDAFEQDFELRNKLNKEF